jgi:hypothetical protein
MGCPTRELRDFGQAGGPFDEDTEGGDATSGNHCVAFPVAKLPSGSNSFGALKDGDSLRDMYISVCVAMTPQPPSLVRTNKEGNEVIMLADPGIIDKAIDALNADTHIRMSPAEASGNLFRRPAKA